MTPQLKEKVVVYYEDFIFADKAVGPPWDEFFVLPPNGLWLREFFAKQTPDTLFQRRAAVAKLVVRCVGALAERQGRFRRLHAAETLAIVFAGVFAQPAFANFAFDSLAVLLSGLEDADVLFPKLVSEVVGMLQRGEASLKRAAINLLLTIVAGNGNPNQQPLTEYFFANNATLAAIIGVLAAPETELSLAARTIVAWALLASFRKGEIKNVFSDGITTLTLSSVFDKVLGVFRTVCKTASDELSGANHGTNAKANFSANTIIRTFSTLWTGYFKQPSAPAPDGIHAAPEDDPLVLQSVLLLFYDLLYSNPRFSATLVNEVEKNSRAIPSLSSSSDLAASLASPTSAMLPSLAPIAGLTATTAPLSNSTLVAFISYASYVFQFNTTKREMGYSRLSLILITLLLEHTDALALFFDATSQCSVDICRSKPPSVPKPKRPTPLAHQILDVLSIALNHSLRAKAFPLDFYLLALNCIHRCLVHQKRFRIRLSYEYNTLWLALSRLLTFLSSNVGELRDRPRFDQLVAQLAKILDFCLLQGELFLPDTLSTAQLVYELVRNRSAPSLLQESSPATDFRNFVKVVACFLPVLPPPDIPTSTEEILALVRQHLDSGALQLLAVPQLDVVTRYTEATETSFFRTLTRIVCGDAGKLINPPAKS